MITQEGISLLATITAIEGRGAAVTVQDLEPEQLDLSNELVAQGYLDRHGSKLKVSHKALCMLISLIGVQVAEMQNAKSK